MGVAVPSGRKILIYQMGKLGSTALVTALARQGCSHRHAETGDRDCSSDVVHTHSHEFAKYFVSSHETQRDLVIITGIRELLSRNISAFFQNMTNTSNRWWYLGTRDEVACATIEELMDAFNARHLAHLEELVEPWFERFRVVVGTNLFSHPFPTAEGYLTLDMPTKVFFYRMEDLPKLTRPLAQFLQLPTLRITREYRSADKWYASRYQKFLAAYKPSRQTLARVYEGPIMRHFYSSAERERFLLSWGLGKVTK